jgi:DNA helicase-2/ATP-dependent DNA helicase PcrA
LHNGYFMVICAGLSNQGMDSHAPLNEMQLAAVTATEGPLLILAGAGSGKTRVITQRIIFLLTHGVARSEILAVTFTNKAAREMESRVKAGVPRKLSRLTICTFHSFGAQILRENASLLGYRPSFTIYDSQDQISLLKETARETGMKIDDLDFTGVAALISGIKSGLRKWKGQDKALKPLYREYQKNLRLANAFDFEDLIMRPIGLLKDFPEVARGYTERYRHILVDEFQDTSSNQYELMRLLASHGNICVVGDDDQSIYSWRGASFRNIVRFERDFPGAREITLEQNYRSTRIILRAANGLIGHNRNRKPKKLWSGLPEGEPIEIGYPETERDEALSIAEEIRTLAMRESLAYQDFGVLLRANHLTRSIEEVFRAEGIPYRISGGTGFYERQEVRDILAYLRLIANEDDDTALLRIANTPRRGLGRRLLGHVMLLAAERGCSLYSAMCAGAAGQALGLEERARGLVSEFLELIRRYGERFSTRKGMAETLRSLVEDIDYWGHLISEIKDKETARWKFGNVESLIGSLAEYEEDPETIDASLHEYLRRIALASRDDPDREDSSGRVSVMTIHAAKGLEFPVVFVAGVEDGLIPHARSVEEASDEEEERRLFYVAITRAKRRLFLSACSSRRRMGKPCEAFPSPFLEELPAECVTVKADDGPATSDEALSFFRETRKNLSR